MRAYSTGIDGDLPFIIYEYLPGRTLRQVLADGPLDWRTAIAAAGQIAAALDRARERRWPSAFSRCDERATSLR